MSDMQHRIWRSSTGELFHDEALTIPVFIVNSRLGATATFRSSVRTGGGGGAGVIGGVIYPGHEPKVAMNKAIVDGQGAYEAYFDPDLQRVNYRSVDLYGERQPDETPKPIPQTEFNTRLVLRKIETLKTQITEIQGDLLVLLGSQD